jgi:chromosome segregation ATPase
MKLKINFLFIILLVLGVVACNQQSKSAYEKQRSLEYIDSLQNDLAQIKYKLDEIDFEEIAHRKQYIISMLDSFQNMDKPQQIDGELKQILIDYQGFAMMYDNLDHHIESIVKEAEELLIQLHTLRQSVEDGDYGKQDFKLYLSEVSNGISELQELRSKYLDPVIDSEAMFLKRMERFEEVVHNIRTNGGAPPVQ